ncbi:glycosyltransferase family 2 protein [Patescibacteria group bacterium]|nr:glycosyltransferase family 2 protein [Patescibacteria group bacterium]MBU1721468.1 glycosyltransferase family 2 protein [Patescibacteria group bacterium]MBU1900775.1 glycosyltransferase family 2 protein [Patescibacteria group bacterium]
MKKEFVSIIIPAYNPKQHIFDRVITSIAAQTYEQIEIIVVDDGSKVPVKVNLELLPARIALTVHRQENAGAPVARNVGLYLSQGEYVICLDADIECAPTMIADMQEAIKKENVDFAYSNFYLWNGKKLRAKAFDIQTLKQANYISSMTLVKKSSAIPWDESLKRFQDWDYWLSMAEEGKIGVHVDEYLYRVIDKGGMSTWLPRFAYRAPFKYLPYISSRVKAYEEAKKIIQKKHKI